MARLTRRTFIGLGLPTMSWILLAACGGAREVVPSGGTPASTSNTPTTIAQAPVATTIQLAPTPACGDADDVTIAQTAGPFFKTSSPERASLIEAGLPGTRLVVTGLVLTRDCRSVARALLDFWQADANGEYDNVGFKLRGPQFTDDSGQFRLETVVPGLYPGRTRHIHVRAQAPNRPVLTTQLYFPNEPGNSRDSIFNPKLVMNVQDVDSGKKASFDFVFYFT